MSPEGETEVVLEKPRRAPRKRALKAVSREASESAPVTRVPKKRTSKKTGEGEAFEQKTSRSTARKAPTPLASEKAKSKKSRKNIIVVAVLILLGVGSSAVVGFTDKGQINVAETVAKRNEAARAAGQPEFTIPVQDTQLPNGGLIGVGDETLAIPPPAAASSTDASASTTEAVSNETASASSTPLGQ